MPADAEWRWAGEALLGQLRAVARIVTRLDAAPARDARSDSTAPRATRGQGNVAGAIALLRSNIGASTEAGRHALRLAVVASLGEALSQALGLYQGRWVAMTVFMVLKPDYASTLSRGVQRAAGTALGVLLCAAVAVLAPPGHGGLVAAAALAIALAYTLYDVNFLAFSLFLTVFIVVLLELLGVPAARTAEARVLNTLLGSALALIAYRLWPTWEGLTAQEKFARLFERQRDYAEALLREVAHPGSLDAAQLRVVESAARRARSDAVAAAVRLSHEPEHRPLTPEVAQALIATAARLAHTGLALHALALSAVGPAHATDQAQAAAPLDDLRKSIVTAMTDLACAIRNLRPPAPIPALRPLHAALRAALPSPDNALASVTDRLVDGVNTLDAILRARLAPEDAVRLPAPNQPS
ncbi:MAG: FUSC family protein [Hyphomicrobiales bacterium]|nr:FUSC family protein [Hyphomicrobiales bacterium]